MAALFGIGAFITFIIFIIYSCIIPAEFARIATKKGYSGGMYGFYVFLFGIPAMILVMALPIKDNPPPKPKTFPCPKCQTTLIKGVESCPKCNAKFKWTTESKNRAK